MTASPAPPRLHPAALADFLRAPDAAEQLSPIDGPGCLVLDLTASAERASSSGLERIEETLPILPCVTIARVPEVDPSGSARTSDARAAKLATLCDTRVDSDPALERLLAGFTRTPLAALAFVHLLRSARGQGVHAGLVAESFVYSTLQAGPEHAAWHASRARRRTRADSEGAGPACRLERDRDVLEIYLARPEKRNAFSRGMRDALCEALQLALIDPQIREVVLRGDGPSFCSGGDLDEFGSRPDPASAHAIRMTRSPALLIARLGNRVRCEVQGACLGAGIELPAFMHHVVADEDAFFALPELALGLIPGAGGTVSLPRRIGRQRAAWLGLSGERIDARTALDWGLVDEIRLGQHGEDEPDAGHADRLVRRSSRPD